MANEQLGFEIRNRPDWLYNSLPYVYIAIGLIVVFGLGTGNLIGVFSGILLVSTGGVVFTMRATHRHELAKIRAELAKRERGADEDDGRVDVGEPMQMEMERRKDDRRRSERRKSAAF